MKFERFVFIIVILAVLAMAAQVSIDSDTWWHLRAGEWIVTHQTVPQSDPFSHTRLGAAWQYPGWLVEAPMYLVYRQFGPAGLNLWTVFMVTLAFAALWAVLPGKPLVRAFSLVLAAATSGVYWAARPYLVTFVLAAVYIRILEEFIWRLSAWPFRRLVWLPVLMVIWANSHGGFAIGFILWGIYTLALLIEVGVQMLRKQRDRDRELCLLALLATGVLMAVAVCLNPSGPVMLLYPFRTAGIQALQTYIQEWQSPDFHSTQAQPFIWMLLLTFGAVGASRRGLRSSDFLLMAVFTYLSLLAWRNVALFALAVAPLLARSVGPVLDAWRRLLKPRPPQPLPPRVETAFRVILIGMVSMVVLVRVLDAALPERNELTLAKQFPAGAVAYLQRERPSGALYNSYNWGGYLLWALPEYPVFIDGRTDLYDDELVDEWLKAAQAQPGWQAVLDQHQVNLVLIEAGSTLDNTLAGETVWREAYRDDLAVVYER